MHRFRSDFLNELASRGYIHQISEPEELDALFCRGRVTAYVGFDCTADSLHVGHLVSIMMLRILERTGHRPIALVGGGTTKVGDPSGRDETRQLLTDAQIEHNKAGLLRSLSKFLDFEKGSALLLDNAEWLDKLEYIPFLREVGVHFTVNRMLTFESVKSRLEREQPLTFLEFNYMIMQAYDFLQLARRYDCRLQMGGSDQWGNIVNGIELARKLDGRHLFALTTPLITTASGQKMGKTAAGAVWLNAERLPPFEYFQFWRNTEDDDVGRFLRLFTELPLSEIERLERLRGAELNEAKKILAFEATALCHGRAAAEKARAAAEAVFEHKGQALEGLPVVPVDRTRLAEGMPIIELFHLAGLCQSHSEARRLVRQGGARLDDRPIEDETMRVDLDTFKAGAVKLSAGKKRHVLVRPV
ncbi:MAG: tyrosine--tRNA ligase [Geminicoccaceae bacterium]|nr:tyrosine--tRNA ligase [Geminicoccaceae bacterium]MCS7268277.1 tyrosine--tRNA ligase [Geminicoccaceae bacterium]MCX7628895.1 tyrosine--tRNA ligase [Geminicoccaceae bacterium]MDW8125141.1 tyrosine--tRNA ligase [Geminicoccaceae bacterium]MDW8340916.1 tyrosine--tRNA ligase [Geminicoccaceae bacterium]